MISHLSRWLSLVCVVTSAGCRLNGRTVTRKGVLILSAIPLLGGLFGTADRRSNETELYLFLTPRILRTDADADSVTVPRLRKGEGR